MNPQRVQAMLRTAAAFDAETHLIQPGLLSPPMVCASSASWDDDKPRGMLLDKAQARAVFRRLLVSDQVICLANGAYDMLVMAVDAAQNGEDLMPAIFAAYDMSRSVVTGYCDGRVFDVQIMESLHAVAQGCLGKDPRSGREMTNPETGRRARYSLQEVVRQVLGREDAKVNDRFRLSYALLADVPIERWPFEAQTYPVDDAVNTLEAALAQAGHIPSCNAHDWQPSLGDPSVMVCSPCGAELTADAPVDCHTRRVRRNIHDLSRQCYVALSMHLGAAWGFRVDQAAVDALEAKHVAEHGPKIQPFLDAKIIRPDGTEDQRVLKQLVATAYGARMLCPNPSCLSGKVPSAKTNGKTRVNCPACDGTGLDLPPVVPRTEKGGIGKGRDVLQESGDDLLMSYADYDEGHKIADTYVPFLRSARVQVPGTDIVRDVPLTLRPNVLLETGRTSYDGVIQLLPRQGGVRECIAARVGWVFSSEDYTAGELVTHAQSCLWLVGYSKLAEALRAGLDAHLALAGTMTGHSYEEMLALKKAGDKTAANARQAAKPANFGFPGGMGELKLVLQQRKQGPDTPCPAGPTMVSDGKGGKVPGYKGLRFCVLMDGAERCGVEKITSYKDRPCPPTCRRCVECARRLRDFWFRQWPENNTRDGYFSKISTMLDGGVGEVTQHVSKRVRGGVEFCSAANGFFQGLLADAAKNALCAASRECYDRTCVVVDSQHMTSAYAGGSSPLLGSRIIVFQHDEIVAEHPESVAHDAAKRLSEIMVEALRYACPDLAPACKAEPTLMRRLYKGAEAVYGPDGRLVPWEPKK